MALDFLVQVNCSTSTRMSELGIMKKLLRVGSRRCCREDMDDFAAGEGLKEVLSNSSHLVHAIDSELIWIQSS